MKYCKRCVMPDTRPGITFNDQGVCSACQAYEARSSVDWDKRWKEFEELCDKYRGCNGDGYDCAIAVSGGKDSHYQIDLMKNVMKMNPVLFSVEDNFPMTNAGIHNLKNISEEFGCHVFSIKPNIKAQKKIMRYMFEKYGKPTWYVDRLIYTYPLNMALKFNTPLLVYGENVSHEYGGNDSDDTYSAKKQLYNGVALGIDDDELIIEKAVGDGIKKVTDSEKDNAKIARKSIVARRSISVGEIFSEENITTKRPGTGISPMRWEAVIGQKAFRNFEEDELIEIQ